MKQPYLLLLMLAVFAGTAARAQEDKAGEKHPCFLQPIFHCAQQLDDGGAIAHFGYDLQCPEDLKIVPDLDIPIGDDNYFSPEPVDRGQTTFFTPGRHVDEFEAEFTADEIKQAKDVHWTVKKISAPVDFSRTRDEDLDCSSLTY